LNYPVETKFISTDNQRNVMATQKGSRSVLGKLLREGANTARH